MHRRLGLALAASVMAVASAQVSASAADTPIVVTSFTLINADTDMPIAGFDPIAPHAVLDLATLPTRRLNVRANTSGSVGSVRFGYDARANAGTESVAPFAFAQDTGGDYKPWTPQQGAHVMSATPHTQSWARGDVGTGLSLPFFVTEGGTAAQPTTFPTSSPASSPAPSGSVAPSPSPSPSPLSSPSSSPSPSPSVPLPPSPSTSLAAEVGRVAMSSDGNQHDNDDWGASSMSLALLAERGLQNNLVHYDYNSHIWDSSAHAKQQMHESVYVGAQRLGFGTARLYDDTDPAQRRAGIANLVAEINASTATNPLWLVIAGPTEMPWRALHAANAPARAHVKCLTHSRWNNTHASTEHSGHSYEDLIALGCQRVAIVDQNRYLGVQPREGASRLGNWAWLKSGDAQMVWLYERLAAYGSGDVSDAGMTYYVLTGDTAGTPDKFRRYFRS